MSGKQATLAVLADALGNVRLEMGGVTITLDQENAKELHAHLGVLIGERHE